MREMENFSNYIWVLLDEDNNLDSGWKPPTKYYSLEWLQIKLSSTLVSGSCRVTLVVAFGFWPKILGCGGDLWMNGTLSFYECRLSGGDYSEVVETLKPYLL